MDVIDGPNTNPVTLIVISGMILEVISVEKVDVTAVANRDVVISIEFVREGLPTCSVVDGDGVADIANSKRLASGVGKPAAGVNAGRSPSVSKMTLSCSRSHCSSRCSSKTSPIGITTVTVPVLFVSTCRRIVLAQGGHTYVLNTSNPATFIFPLTSPRDLSLPNCLDGLLPADTREISKMRSPIMTREERRLKGCCILGLISVYLMLDLSPW